MKVSAVLLQNVIGKFLSKAQVGTPKYIVPLQSTGKDIVYKTFNDLNNWYTRVLGLDEVKQYQDRVVSLQERLFDAQDKRREVGLHLAEVRRKSNTLQDEIHKVNRQEDLQKFLNLMRDETEVLRLEKEISQAFQQCDQMERELFTAFTNAVRDSHEKQRAQLEYTKYFGIILSITGSFLAFCYTSLRKHDLKNFIETKLTALEPLTLQQLSNLDHKLQDSHLKVSDILETQAKTNKSLLEIQDRDRRVFAEVLILQEKQIAVVYCVVVGCAVMSILRFCC